VLGRFLSADTIVPEPDRPQGLNRYAYTYNNPVKYTDPTGHFTPEAVSEYCSNHPETCNLQAWQNNENWWNMLMTAVAGDVLALINSNGKLGYFSFQGTGDSALTGVAWADNLAGKLHTPLSDIPKGTDLSDISFLQRYFPGKESGGMAFDLPTPDIAEAGLWRFENGLLTSKYHTDPRVKLESHIITHGEVQWETTKFTIRTGALGAFLSGPVLGFVYGIGSNLLQNEAFPNLAEGNNALTIDRSGTKAMFRYDPWQTGTFARSTCYMAIDGCLW
jgi:hypothetical protein